jgi:hypothetical protein
MKAFYGVCAFFLLSLSTLMYAVIDNDNKSRDRDTRTIETVDKGFLDQSQRLTRIETKIEIHMDEGKTFGGG